MRRSTLALVATVIASLGAACSGARPVPPTHPAPPTTVARPGSTGFPEAIYPPSVPAATANGVTSQCPNPAGVTAVPSSARSAAIEAAMHLGAVSRDSDLHNADPSYWGEVNAAWAAPKPPAAGAQAVVSVGPWGVAPEYDFVAAACGERLARQSLVVALGPPEAVQGTARCEACVTRFFFIARAGRPLLYLVY